MEVKKKEPSGQQVRTGLDWFWTWMDQFLQKDHQQWVGQFLEAINGIQYPDCIDIHRKGPKKFLYKSAPVDSVQLVQVCKFKS